jgi:hypothetical protein
MKINIHRIAVQSAAFFIFWVLVMLVGALNKAVWYSSRNWPDVSAEGYWTQILDIYEERWKIGAFVLVLLVWVQTRSRTEPKL